jgi:hypothetical protein
MVAPVSFPPFPPSHAPFSNSNRFFFLKKQQFFHCTFFFFFSFFRTGVLQMWIYLRKEWVERAGLTADDVLLAGMNARCCLESNPAEMVGPCMRCGSRKKALITCRASSRAVFGPAEVSPGVLRYCFNLCRSGCTSSRDHLRSRVVLVVDGLQPGLVLRSPPMVLRSREKIAAAKDRRPPLEHPLTALSQLASFATDSPVPSPLLPSPVPPPPPSAATAMATPAMMDSFSSGSSSSLPVAASPTAPLLSSLLLPVPALMLPVPTTAKQKYQQSP